MSSQVSETWLGSPLFIGHLGHSEGEQPYLEHENDHHVVINHGPPSHGARSSRGLEVEGGVNQEDGENHRFLQSCTPHEP